MIYLLCNYLCIFDSNIFSFLFPCHQILSCNYYYDGELIDSCIICNSSQKEPCLDMSSALKKKACPAFGFTGGADIILSGGFLKILATSDIDSILFFTNTVSSRSKEFMLLPEIHVCPRMLR